MKSILLAALLAVSSTASADTYSGPPGAYDEPVNNLESPPPPRRHRANGQLKAEILARFDKNGDGKLDRRERRQAIRALKRIARRLQREGRGRRDRGADFDIDIDIR
jgi:hypothetical protein